MIHSFAKHLLAIAIVAISILPAASVQADSPQAVVPAGGTSANQSSLQQVGHQQCASGVCTSGSECCEYGCKECGTRHGVCQNDGYCEKCRRLGLLGRIRYCGLFGRRCQCDTCRFGGSGSGYGGPGGPGGSGNPFLPNGCGGKGCPPFGAYQMVYPLNPDHCDMRDTHVHAAQGYGVPMAVPLAPVVRHQYNYSWGVPASRITHISNHAPQHLNGGMPGGYPGYAGPQMVPGGAYPPGYCPQCQAGAAHGH